MSTESHSTDIAATEPDVREAVRQRYAAAATATSCRGSAPADLSQDAQGAAVFGSALYDGADVDQAAGAALAGSLGCGVPTAVADLFPGETVLDLGSGAGGDVLLAAARVAPGGRAIGLDMTEEMLNLARRNAEASGVANVEFVRGYLEDIPLPDASVDVPTPAWTSRSATASSTWPPTSTWCWPRRPG